MSPKKLFIIGAGASNGAAHINEEYPPPLTPDLSKIFENDFISLNHTVHGQFIRKWFADLLKETGTEDDIENFFTLFFELAIICSRLPLNYRFLSKEQLHELLSKPELLDPYFSKDDYEKIRKIFDYYLRKTQASILGGPGSFENFYSVGLCEYMRVAITDNNCEYHASLFQDLTPEDAVASFNYDSICDFTLYRLGKLTHSSFEGLGFSEINILNDKNSDRGVKFLHIHGSFNWWRSADKNGMHDDVCYNLLNEGCKSTLKGNTPYPLILPFKLKQELYESISIYKRHVDMFLKLIEESTIIYLVGKTFENSDYELFALIQERSKKLPKELYIIDKILDDPIRKNDFIKNHEKLFNARFVKGWIDLAQYSELNKNNKSIH